MKRVPDARASATKKKASKKAVPRNAVNTVKPASKKAASKKAASKKAASKQAAPKTATKASKAKPAVKAAPRAQVVARRADLGGSIEPFLAKQPPEQRAIIDALMALIRERAPDATASLKWGMPFFIVGDQMVCAVASFKAHVNLILRGGSDTYADPQQLLQGDGKTGRHLKMRKREDVPTAAIRGWLATATTRARANQGKPMMRP